MIIVDALELKLESDISEAEDKEQSENSEGIKKNVNNFILYGIECLIIPACISHRDLRKLSASHCLVQQGR